MSFLKLKTVWLTGELWLFKWGVFTAGILAGYYLREYLAPYLSWLWLVSGIACFLSAYFWIAKTKR